MEAALRVLVIFLLNLMDLMDTIIMEMKVLELLLTEARLVTLRDGTYSVLDTVDNKRFFSDSFDTWVHVGIVYDTHPRQKFDFIKTVSVSRP